MISRYTIGYLREYASLMAQALNEPSTHPSDVCVVLLLSLFLFFLLLVFFILTHASRRSATSVTGVISLNTIVKTLIGVVEAFERTAQCAHTQQTFPQHFHSHLTRHPSVPTQHQTHIWSAFCKCVTLSYCNFYW
jgi:hypothetical protein